MPFPSLHLDSSWTMRSYESHVLSALEFLSATLTLAFAALRSTPPGGMDSTAKKAPVGSQDTNT